MGYPTVVMAAGGLVLAALLLRAPLHGALVPATLVMAGVTTVLRPLRALEAIVRATAEAEQHARRIATTATRQDEALARLAGRVREESEIAAKNRASAAQLAQRAEDQARALAELERAAQELTAASVKLGEVARRFASA